MQAKIKTKSNYRGLNGQFLKVHEIAGKRVTCEVFQEEFNKIFLVDFTLKEIEEFKQTATN
jgi:hypothetical protein